MKAGEASNAVRWLSRSNRRASSSVKAPVAQPISITRARGRVSMARASSAANRAA